MGLEEMGESVMEHRKKVECELDRIRGRLLALSSANIILPFLTAVDAYIRRGRDDIRAVRADPNMNDEAAGVLELDVTTTTALETVDRLVIIRMRQ